MIYNYDKQVLDVNKNDIHNLGLNLRKKMI